MIYAAPGTNFTSAWNEFTFLVAPTIFWYLPYGLIYHFIGSAIPIVVYFIICLILVIVFQGIGIAMGSGRRKKLRERAERREKEKNRSALKRSLNLIIKKKTSCQPAGRATETKEKAPPKPQPKRLTPKIHLAMTMISRRLFIPKLFP